MLLAVLEMGTGLARAQGTSTARQIQADVDVIANATASATDRARAQANLLAVIGTPGGQERFVVMFENEVFAIRAGNWLENVRPVTAQDRTNVCEAALGVLHNTNEKQLIMAMSHAVLRQVVNQIQDDPTVNPLSLAGRIIKEVKAEIDGAAARSRMSALRDISNAMSDEAITSAQRKFLEQVSVLSTRRPPVVMGPKLAAKTQP